MPKIKFLIVNGTLKEYERQYDNLVFADRESLINLSAVKNFNTKEGMVYFDSEQKIGHSLSVRRRRKILAQLEKR